MANATSTPDETAARFERDMEERVYRQTGKECGYWAGRFLQSVRRHGGVETARRLLRRRGTSAGFDTLRERQRLDLSMEWLVLLPEYRGLFTADELAEASRRLGSTGVRVDASG